MTSDSRYARQIALEPIGEAGQARIRQGDVVIVGCGALGSVLADTMVRAGVGRLRVYDPDRVELNNLQRQSLYTEEDVAGERFKVDAAMGFLRKVNSEVEIAGEAVKVYAGNIESLVDGASLILDGTDNFETRFLLNDVSVKLGIPWVYGGAVAGQGICMPVIPGETACLRCVMDILPQQGSWPSNVEIGVLGPLIHIVAGLQSAEAIKILSGRPDLVSRKILAVDTWAGRVSTINAMSMRERTKCPCCRQGVFDYLSKESGDS